MPHDRQIYLLDPQKLPPETIAVTFAKTSRSPHSFREIAAELTDEKSAEFHEKWVVGYGHASVAEHAVLHLAIENVSRLAIETLESNRLASYTEKSTRYQKWDPEGYFIPPELHGHTLEPLYLATIRTLFDTYHQSLPAVKAAVAQENPRLSEETEAAWERRVRSEYVDVCRFLLPAASLANVGMTLNARALEHAISKLLSHPLEEVRAIGSEVKAAALAEVPTLVKYADVQPYLVDAASRLRTRAAALPQPSGDGDWCCLVDYDQQAEDAILASALYRFSGMSLASARAALAAASPAQRRQIAEDLLGGLGKHDIPLRELEYSHFTFDTMMDQGAYFEVKRHRMMTQTPQDLTTRLGYAVPRLIRAAGMEDAYRAAMQAAQQAYETLAAYDPVVAAYLVPNGYNRRVLLHFNLRSAMHFVRLRTAPNAHFSVRRVAGRIGQMVTETLPLLGRYLNPGAEETWRDVEEKNFVQLS